MEKRTKRWGDRPDACWIRDLDGLHAIMPHLMNKRTDAEVYVNMEFDVTEALRYIEEKNRGEDEYKTTLFHCILMAVAKTVSDLPPLPMSSHSNLLHGKKLPLVFPNKMQHLHPLTAVSRSSHHPPDIFRLPKHK